MKIADHRMTRAILERHRFTFKKSLGQNFLTNPQILQQIVEIAGLEKRAVNVIEIGPGIGALTEYLAQEATEVISFEIDERLLLILSDTLKDATNVRIIHQDILKTDIIVAIQQFSDPTLPVKVVANLPYYITTPILMHFIHSQASFCEMIVMMQKEVADRLVATPGTKAYGSLSVATQYYMHADIALSIPRSAFIPSPRVDSAILKLTRRPQPPCEVVDEQFYFQVVKAGFLHRRKTLWNNLLAFFGKSDPTRQEIRDALQEAQIPPSVRGETLSLSDFARLANQLYAKGLARQQKRG